MIDTQKQAAAFRGQRLNKGKVVKEYKKWDELDPRVQAELQRQFVEDGITMNELADHEGVNVRDLIYANKRQQWTKKREAFVLKKAQDAAKVGELKGIEKVGKEYGQELTARIEQTKRMTMIERIKQVDAESLATLDMMIDQLRIALGATEMDAKLMELNPETYVTKAKQLVMDKEVNANYVRLSGRMIELMNQRRLFQGQSTSAANKENPGERESEQQGLRISLASIEGVDDDPIADDYLTML